MGYGPATLASQTDRERVLTVLANAYAENYINKPELDRRQALVLKTGARWADLSKAEEGLPVRQLDPIKLNWPWILAATFVFILFAIGLMFVIFY